jgi:hypothetical protein
MRGAIEVRFGEAKQAYKNGEWASYKAIIRKAKFEQGFPETWIVSQVRAEDDRIIGVCEENPPTPRAWLLEKTWPPLSTTGDRVREAARRAQPGAWSTSKPAVPVYHPMLEPGLGWKIGQELQAREVRDYRLR